MDLSQIQIHIFDFKFNPFNWIRIQYRLDTFLDYPKWILDSIFTWTGSKLNPVNLCLGRAKLVQVHVEPSQSGTKPSRVGPGQSQAEFVQAQVKPSRPRPKSTRVSAGQSRLESSRPRPKSS